MYIYIAKSLHVLSLNKVRTCTHMSVLNFNCGHSMFEIVSTALYFLVTVVMLDC